ncbi:MAG: glycoside hydrolase family 13 protein, partial [Clostridiales bacterium]|nr:glycoside hydrolase family 13 protein [Clostridiales bacterium]
MQIRHNSQDLRYRQPFGAVTCGETVTLNIYAPGCAGAAVRLWQNQSGETMIPMSRSAALFSAKIKMPENPCILWYFFVLNYGNKVICYGNNPESLGGEGCIYENSQPPSFQITVHNPFKAASWYKNGLVYQIFPDRFARGEDFEERKAAALLPEGWQEASRFFEEDWHALPRYIRGEGGAVTDWQFFGGTLNGIREKIPYLKSLGVTALYLNPIFRGTSNHRYDTADYMQVDPLLGDNETFRSLAEECRKNGIRIILDGVFSHTGADSIYFDKYGNYKNFAIKNPEDPKELGAWLHEDSKYRAWYRFKDEPPGYECWWGVTDLPNVEETEPTYDSYICGPGGVLENWLELGASGFRLDVADELPDSFIKNIRSALKEKDAENLLIGEVWEDASNKHSYGELRRYFAGDELDAVMNYPFRDSAIDYCIGKESAEMFCRKMRSLQENYPAEAFYGSLNIIGGHDCHRILSVLGGYTPAKEDQRGHDGRFVPKGAALDLNEEQYAQAKARLKMLSCLQYTMPGVPCVYYGDEAG